MAFDKKHLRIISQVGGVVSRAVYAYDTADILTVVTAADYFADPTLEMGDQIEVMIWPAVPNANERTPAQPGDVFKSTAAPANHVTLTVTSVTLADGTVTATAI